MLLHHHDCFGFNIKFLFYLFIFHIGCINIATNVIFIYFFLFIPSSEMAASSFHIEQPQDNGMFSRRKNMLTGPGWSWRGHADGY